MSQRTADGETILRGVLDGWKAAVDEHQPDRAAAHFTDDAVFQGLHPYSVGRPGIAAYYDSQPLGMTAEYRVLETRRLADDLVLGYLNADFSFIDRPAIHVHLGVLLKRTAADWAIAFYQVSRREQEAAGGGPDDR
ncbi:hypothetical protein ABTX81_05990 [Kitasatospora sp. NPDC097605]|uniref:hypothetical protein n=1 Tax=Kitasatospora sp. NPDC097605 TaxID=3157226 RepID=UPI00332AB671